MENKSCPLRLLFLFLDNIERYPNVSVSSAIALVILALAPLL